jgi:subtilase family serine protease
MPLTVQADPFNTFKEISKTNNQASIPITVNGTTLPNLYVSYKDIVITPNPAKEQGALSISALVKNTGFSSVENVKVNFYKGVPNDNGVLIGTKTITALAVGGRVPSRNSPGTTTSLSPRWRS